MLETLRYADEVNRAQGYFRDIGDRKPDEELLDLAETLIDQKTGDVRRQPSSTTAMSMRCKELIDEKRKTQGQEDHRGRRDEPAGARLERDRPDGGAEARA